MNIINMDLAQFQPLRENPDSGGEATAISGSIEEPGRGSPVDWIGTGNWSRGVPERAGRWQFSGGRRSAAEPQLASAAVGERPDEANGRVLERVGQVPLAFDPERPHQ